MKKMLLLGDSINLHYGPNLKGYLADEYEIQSRPGEKEALKDIDKAVGGNGGDSLRVLNYIKDLEKRGLLNFDLFVFNCGLHDIKRVVPEEKYQVTVDKYEENINSVYMIMQEHGIKCVFVTTTPILEKAHNVEIIPAGVKRYNADVRLYNEVAIKTAKKYNSPVIDLYSFVENLTGEKYLDYAHFNYEVRKLQAAYIAGAIRSLD